MIALALLWANAVLYAAFTVWCTWQPRKAMDFLGYLAPNRTGIAEFLTVYGGLQAGLAVFYAIAALVPSFSRAAVVFSVCIYAGIVAWRSGAFLVNGLPVENKGIFLVFALEVALLLWSLLAAWQLFRR